MLSATSPRPRGGGGVSIARSVTSPAITLVFTDLDNTLYDWVAWYSRAFYRMLDGAATRADIPRARLLREMKTLYRLRHRLEEPEALLHAPSIRQRFGEPSRAREALSRVFESYYHTNYGTGLRSYPGVRATLQRMAAMGVAVVGHTEAPANHAVARLRSLGLEHAFVSLLAAPSALDDPTTLEQEHHGLPFGIRTVGSEERKPNPAVVLEMCQRIGVGPGSALYVGDRLDHDIGMARRAGLWTAWARYGTQHDPRDWQRIVDLSPWSTTQRTAARVDVPTADATPHAVLHDSFEELLLHFDFEAPSLPPPSSGLERVAP